MRGQFPTATARLSWALTWAGRDHGPLLRLSGRRAASKHGRLPLGFPRCQNKSVRTTFTKEPIANSFAQAGSPWMLAAQFPALSDCFPVCGPGSPWP